MFKISNLFTIAILYLAMVSLYGYGLTTILFVFWILIRILG